MSSLSSDVSKFIKFVNLSYDKISSNYSKECELIEWNVQIDVDNLVIIKKNIKGSYYTDNDFYTDIYKLALNDETELYRTILKIIDILDLNESQLDIKLSKIFLGSPHFNNCGEGH
jgi:hypothetical protein